jgi:hypothetical protein
MSSRKPIKLSSIPKLKKSINEEDDQVAVINPYTNRPVKVGGRVWKKIQKVNMGKGNEKEKPGRKQGTYNRTIKPKVMESDSDSDSSEIRNTMNRMCATLNKHIPSNIKKKSKIVIESSSESELETESYNGDSTDES